MLIAILSFLTGIILANSYHYYRSISDLRPKQLKELNLKLRYHRKIKDAGTYLLTPRIVAISDFKDLELWNETAIHWYRNIIVNKYKIAV